MPARVLLVEDNSDVRLVLRLHLEPLFDVIEAADGLTGWKQFQSNTVDCVLLDLGLPGINGLDLCEKIKNHPERGSTPVIIVTGATRDEQLPANFWKIGTSADAFLEKPVEGAKLRSEIDRLLKLKANHRELPPGTGSYE